MGLLTDGLSLGLRPFEAEMRRRLWWQIVLIDQRVGELSGVGTTFLTYTWNTKIPFNANDSELYIDMNEPPVDRSGATEMTFVRLRCELLHFREALISMDQPAMREKLIDEFDQRLERDYISHCNPSIPLHCAAIKRAHTDICKLRCFHNHPIFTGTASTLRQDKISVFTLA
jgi:hypothetical protein